MLDIFPKKKKKFQKSVQNAGRIYVKSLHESNELFCCFPRMLPVNKSCFAIHKYTAGIDFPALPSMAAFDYATQFAISSNAAMKITCFDEIKHLKWNKKQIK